MQNQINVNDIMKNLVFKGDDGEYMVRVKIVYGEDVGEEVKNVLLKELVEFENGIPYLKIKSIE